MASDKSVLLPADLQCPVCCGLYSDAVLTPCCATSTCQKCAGEQLAWNGNRCWTGRRSCQGRLIFPKDLIPNRKVRRAVQEFLEEQRDRQRLAGRKRRAPDPRLKHQEPLPNLREEPCHHPVVKGERALKDENLRSDFLDGEEEELRGKRRIKDEAVVKASLQNQAAVLLGRIKQEIVDEEEEEVVEVGRFNPTLTASSSSCSMPTNVQSHSVLSLSASATSGQAKVCLLCNSDRHVTKNCPSLSNTVCRACGVNGHPAFSCPERRKRKRKMAVGEQAEKNGSDEEEGEEEGWIKKVSRDLDLLKGLTEKVMLSSNETEGNARSSGSAKKEKKSSNKKKKTLRSLERRLEKMVEMLERWDKEKRSKEERGKRRRRRSSSEKSDQRVGKKTRRGTRRVSSPVVKSESSDTPDDGGNPSVRRRSRSPWQKFSKGNWSPERSVQLQDDWSSSDDRRRFNRIEEVSPPPLASCSSVKEGSEVQEEERGRGIALESTRGFHRSSKSNHSAKLGPKVFPGHSRQRPRLQKTPPPANFPVSASRARKEDEDEGEEQRKRELRLEAKQRKGMWHGQKQDPNRRSRAPSPPDRPRNLPPGDLRERLSWIRSKHERNDGESAGKPGEERNYEGDLRRRLGRKQKPRW